jgi:hypothetical protein
MKKIDFSSFKEKLFKKNSETKAKRKPTDYVSLAILLLGILGAAAVYYFYKNLIIAIGVALAGALLAYVSYLLLQPRKSQAKDSGEETTALDFVDRILSYLLSGDTFGAGYAKAVEEIKPSLFKDKMIKAVSHEEGVNPSQEVLTAFKEVSPSKPISQLGEEVSYGFLAKKLPTGYVSSLKDSYFKALGSYEGDKMETLEKAKSFLAGLFFLFLFYFAVLASGVLK